MHRHGPSDPTTVGPRLLAAPAAVALAAALALGAAACDAPSGPGAAAASAAVSRASNAATYRVTLHNTAGALQPLTPAVIALHAPATGIYTVGEPASPQLERLAESGMRDPLAALLGNDSRVFDVTIATGPDGPFLPDEEGSATIQGPPGSRLSLAAMLVCTNDGFTGLDGVRLPGHVGGTETFQLHAYDAGTEQNTEASTDLVPPCVMATTGSEGGTVADQPAIAEQNVVRPHPGIDDDTDGDDILTVGQHQWSDPIATVRVERIH